MGSWSRQDKASRVAALALALCSSLTLASEDAGVGTPRRSVLIVSGFQQGLPVSDALVDGAVSALKERGVSANDLYVEMLDLARNDDPAWRASLASLLRTKLAPANVAVVIAQNQSALDFLAQEGNDLVPPEVPVLSALTERPAVTWRGPPRHVLNITHRWDLAGTLRLGLELFPRTRRLLVVAGADDLHSSFFEQAGKALAALKSTAELEDTAGLTYDAVLQRASTLPPDTLVVLGTYARDAAGRRLVPVEVAADLSRRANAPVLALYDAHVRAGLMGGSVVMPETVGQRAGAIGYEVLAGQRVLDADGDDTTVRPQPMFDWCQLERWGADPSRLPKETVFQHRPRTLWSEYHDVVLAASATIALLSVLVVSLAVQNRRRKRAEEALERSRQLLERKVVERTASLAEATQRADAASVAKTSFLANMSHEIRTPLNVMVGMAHLVRRGGLSAEQASRMDKLEVAATHLLEIINAVLDLSKIDAGKFTLEELPLRVESVVANVFSMLEPRAQAKGLRLVSELDPLPRDLVGDPTRLQQALLNYVNNALKFTDAGSVKVRARVEAQDDTSALVRFEVEDTGPGIEAQIVARLFSAFEQADSSTTRKTGGTGLGLAITKKLAELMGGTAGVRTAPGQGSTFWFTARLRKTPQPTPGPAADVERDAATLLKQRHAGARILVVEDNEMNREVAQVLLTDVGLVVDLAEDGLEAVQRVAAHDYRLVLMDMQMPRMDGLEATREIRKMRPASALPIIAMTANAFSEDKARCHEAGMDDFVSKPVDPEALYAVLLGWLDQQRPPLSHR